MKKIIGLLLALAMVMTLAATAFATGGQLFDGDNEIELPFDVQSSSYTYTATQTGTLYVAATYFASSVGDYDYYDNSTNMYEWEWYTTLTVNGALLDNLHYGTLEVVAGETYEFIWRHKENANSGWYHMGWYAELNLSYNEDSMPVAGSEDYPVELNARQCPIDSVEIAAGGIAYYTLIGFGGSNFTVTGENAYISATVYNLETALHEDVYYEAVDGVVTMPINSSYAKIQIGNAGNEPAVFGLNYHYSLGGEMNPAQLVMGENTAHTKANDYDGYYFQWRAEATGTLTLTFPASGWTYTVRNLVNGQTFYGSYDHPDALNPLALEVAQGDAISICVNTFNAAGYTVPGGNLTFTAAFEAASAGVCQHVYEVTASAAGTCALPVSVTYTCTACGESYTEEGELDAANHEALSLIVAGYDATCYMDGFKSTWYCSACEGLFADEAGTIAVTYEEQIIPMLPHAFEAAEFVAGTCATPGSTTYVCTNCEEAYAEEGQLDPANHESLSLIVAGYDATCEASGFHSTWYCAGCEGLFADEAATIPTTYEAQIIPATGHSFGDWFDSGDGILKHTCSVCGWEEIYCAHENTELTGAADATCDADGYTGDRICTDCGAVVSQGEAIAAIGHNYVAGESVAATCATPASTVFTCATCSHSYTDSGETDPANHESLSQIVIGYDATCYMDGYKSTWYCNGCEGLFADDAGTIAVTYGDQVIPMLDHAESDWVTVQEATQESTGLKQKTCTICGEILVEEEIPALNNNPDTGDGARWIAVLALLSVTGTALLLTNKKRI